MGLRTISVHMRSSPALDALWTLERAPASTVGAALRRALVDELERLREPLSFLAECVWWLAETKVFQRTRAAAKSTSGWKPGRPVRSSALFEGQLALDVGALVEGVESGDETARVTSVATRSVVDALREGALVVAEDARAGRTKMDAGTLARELKAHLERAERAALRATERAARELERAERAEAERRERAKSEREERKAQRARVEREREERERVERERATGERARREREKRAREELEREKRERAERENAERAREERERAARASAGKKGRKKAKPTSFGGLPDDAEPEDRTRERELLGARGLPLDAEFFLDEAVLPWPCDGRALDAARKQLLLRFHPDRAGDAGVEKFQRAMRGYHTLVRALEKVGSPTRPADHGPRVAAAHATQPPAAAPTSAATAASVERADPRTASENAEKKRERAARRPRAATSDATARTRERDELAGHRAASSPQQVRGAAVGEWPPRARSK